MSLFASIDRSPYNTVTSPAQQGALDTGNESDSTQKYPMQKIIAAVMRGAAHVQGQSQAKAVAKSQMANNAKMTVTMKPGAPGEPPLVTVKDAPADLLNGTQQADLIAAHDTPIKQVESKLSNQPVTESADNAPVSAPIVQPSPDHPLEMAAAAVDAAKGYRLARPWDTDIADKLKSEDGLRAIAEEMGLRDTKAEASRAWKQLQRGVVKPEEVLRRVADFRARKIEEESHALQVTLAPYEQQKLKDEIEANRLRDDERAAKALTDSEQKAALKNDLDFLRTNDLSIIDPEALKDSIESATGHPWTEAALNRAKLKQREDVNKAFLDYTDTKKDTFALGNQPTWAAAKAAFGHPLTPQQDTIGKARWQAARAYVVRKAADDSLQQELRAARLEAIHARIEAASKDKPTPIGRGDLALMPAEELIASDPSKIKNFDAALEQKEGLIRKEIAEHKDKEAKAAAVTKAILTKPADRRQFGDEEQLAGYQADLRTARGHIEAAQAELQQITAARAARKQGKAPTPAAKKKPDPLGIR